MVFVVRYFSKPTQIYKDIETATSEKRLDKLSLLKIFHDEDEAQRYVKSLRHPTIVDEILA